MSTPEFIALKCDHCPSYLGEDDSPSTMEAAACWMSHASAYRSGRRAGWYIAEVELCPTCAEAYAIEKSSEEEA